MNPRISYISAFADLARAFFWLLLMVIIVYHWIGKPSLETRRIAAIEAMEKELGARVITLIHHEETISLFGIPIETYMTVEDAEEVLRAIRLTPEEEPIDMIIHTQGGFILAAAQIANALRNHRGKVTVFIPHHAMSGGTLVALAADEMVMDPNAVLGPVDPQIGDLPATSILSAVDTKTPQNVEDQTLILADIAMKAVNQVNAMVFELLEGRLPRSKIEEVSRMIASGQYTHDFPITVERAREAGLPITTRMPQSIYRLMDLYPQRVKGEPSVGYIPLRKAS